MASATLSAPTACPTAFVVHERGVVAVVPRLAPSGRLERVEVRATPDFAPPVVAVGVALGGRTSLQCDVRVVGPPGGAERPATSEALDAPASLEVPRGLRVRRDAELTVLL